MNTRQDIESFFRQKTFAVAGLSRDPNSFSARAGKELKSKGFRLLPVNPNAESIDGEKCWPNLASLPEKVEGVILFTPSSVTEKVVREAAAAGIRKVWIQQGAQSEGAVRFCVENKLEAVSGKCVLMFAEPVASFHAFHRWFAKLFGQVPR